MNIIATSDAVAQREARRPRRIDDT